MASVQRQSAAKSSSSKGVLRDASTAKSASNSRLSLTAGARSAAKPGALYANIKPKVFTGRSSTSKNPESARCGSVGPFSQPDENMIPAEMQDVLPSPSHSAPADDADVDMPVAPTGARYEVSAAAPVAAAVCDEEDVPSLLTSSNVECAVDIDTMDATPARSQGPGSAFATPTAAAATQLFSPASSPCTRAMPLTFAAPACSPQAKEEEEEKAAMARAAAAVASLVEASRAELASISSALPASPAGAHAEAAAAAAAAAAEKEAAMIAAGPPSGVTHMYKVLVVGNAKCGKTSLIHRYTKGLFRDVYETTIGADYARKVVPQADGSHVHLQLWDLAGQDRFAKLTRPYYRNARAAIVVCDISRQETLAAVRAWKQELDAQFGLDTKEGRDAFPVVLLMNKSDLLAKSVDELLRMGQELERLKNELGFTAAFTTSAKESKYVTETMDCVIENIRKADAGKDDDDDDDVDALLARGAELKARRAATAAAAVSSASPDAEGVIDLKGGAAAPGGQARCCY